jgi:hypothetical protein
MRSSKTQKCLTSNSFDGFAINQESTPPLLPVASPTGSRCKGGFHQSDKNPTLLQPRERLGHAAYKPNQIVPLIDRCANQLRGCDNGGD